MATRKKSRASKPRSRPAAKAAGSGSGVAGGTGDAPLTFEAALERLEGLVDRLEDGELELEESLEVFEQGVALSKQCASRLEAAERRVDELVRSGGEWLTRPFDESFEAGDGDALHGEDG